MKASALLLLTFLLGSASGAETLVTSASLLPQEPLRKSSSSEGTDLLCSA